MTGDHAVPLKVGILSFAHPHAIDYVRLLQRYDGIELRAADPGPHPPGELRGSDLAARLGVAFDDSSERLMEWGPDAVVVTSENALHRPLVELAAAGGAHILCEKPLATTWEDGKAIADAVSAAGVQLMVAFPVRFASIFTRVQAEYESGALGELVAVRGSNNGKLPLERRWFTDPALSGGGALVDHVVHIADLLEALMHSAPLTVTAVTNRILHASRAEAETAGLVTITYENGVIAAVDCSWSRPETAPTWGGLQLSILSTAGTVDLDFFGPRARGLRSETGAPIELPYGPDYNAALLGAFLHGVRSGTPQQPDVHAGLRTLQVVLAAQESARTGATVALPTSG
jgi:predicted dehydrogenase